MNTSLATASRSALWVAASGPEALPRSGLRVASHARVRLAEQTGIDADALARAIDTGAAHLLCTSASGRRLFLVFDPASRSFAAAVVCQRQEVIVAVFSEEVLAGTDALCALIGRPQRVAAAERAGLTPFAARLLVHRQHERLGAAAQPIDSEEVISS